MARELINSWQDYLGAADRLLAIGGHELRVFDEDLAPLHWEAPQRLPRITDLLAAPGDRPLRIALHDGDHLLKHSPRLHQTLITWSHRCAVRQTPAQLGQLRDALIIIDERHALIRFEKRLPRSVLLIDEALAVGPYRMRFEEIWAASQKNLLQTTLGL